MCATSVGEDFPNEVERVYELLGSYKELRGTPGVNVEFAIHGISAALKQAKEAQQSNDPVQILRAYQALKDCE